MEILNVRQTATGYLVNGYIDVSATDPQIVQWLEDGKEIMPEYTQKELDDIAKAEAERLKDEAKKAGKPYTLNGVEYIVPLDKDAQDTVTAITVANIAGLFVSTTMEFSNGVKMPIKASEWTAFVQWFVTERGKFFEVVA